MSYQNILKNQFVFFLKLTGLSLLLFLVHYYIFISFFNELVLLLPLWLIYVVNFGLVYLLYTIINYKKDKGSDNIFNSFMTGTILKMILIIVFLLPVIVSEQENKIPDVLNFFIPYFIFLGFEVYSVFTFLSKK